VRILVVDDDPFLARGLGRVLKQSGHDVTLAGDGDEALKLARSGAPDLVLTDIDLPGRDGLSLLDTIHREAPHVDCILMTGGSSVSSAVGAMRNGATDYLLKPFSNEELSVRVAAIAERRSLRAELSTARAALSDRLGPYMLGKKIGSGGMGVVCEASHAMLRRPTAVKMLRADVMNEESLARFEREVQQTCRLTHPNTISVFDYGRSADGVFYYAMELLDGASVADIVAQTGRFPVRRAVHVLKAMCGSLAEAHSKGLVHRDIKPNNIQLCERGGIYDTVKVLDFGLVLDVSTPGAAEQHLLGTPGYLAPETIGNRSAVTPLVDVYALGGVAYFMLAGHPPFPDGSVSDKLLWHQTRQPTPIRYIRREVPEGLAIILEKMMVKDMRNRYQTPEEIDIALAPWTTTPIPAPTLAELPMLSPAAMEGINLTRGPREEGSWSGNMPNPMNPSVESSPVPTASGGSSSVIPAASTSYPSASSINFGPNPGAVPTTAPPRSLLTPPSIGTASTSRNYAPQGPPDPTQRQMNPPRTDPASDTGSMTNTQETTLAPTERPPPVPRVAPAPAFPRPDSNGSPGSMPPTNIRMILVILLTAFIGSSLGMLAWSLFMGGSSQPNNAERRSEK